MKRKVRLLIKISFNTTAIEMAKVSRAPSPGNPYAFLFRNQRAGVVQTKYLALRCVLFYLFLSNEPIVLLPKENIGITVCSPLNLSSRWRSWLFASLQDDTPKHKQHSYFNHGKFYHWMNAYENVIENNHFRMFVSGKYTTFGCYTGTRPIIKTSHHLLPCLIWSVADYSICVLCSHFNGICFYKLYPDIIILIRV